MTGIQTIKVTLQRDSLQTAWGFRLSGGADFQSPFTISKITAGSPSDGILHRGDVVLEIDQRPVGALLHAEALSLVQRAGGQISFLIQRGLHVPPPTTFAAPRPYTAVPWSLGSTTSYLNRVFNPPWSSPYAAPSPATLYRSRPMERIPDPKPILSQTGSPLMPGPVPSVSTKTRGYTQPPSYHTEPNTYLAPSPYQGPFLSENVFDSNSRPRASSNTGYHTTAIIEAQHVSPWHSPSQVRPSFYVPSYQKKVQPAAAQPKSNFYSLNRPGSTQPVQLVHRQYNSPMSLYSQNNVQDVLKSHASHISRISFVPSQPKPTHSYVVSLTEARPKSEAANPTINVITSDF